jgi:hypothetical protein
MISNTGFDILMHITLKHLPLISLFNSFCQSPALQTLSNAFFKSMKSCLPNEKYSEMRA